MDDKYVLVKKEDWDNFCLYFVPDWEIRAALDALTVKKEFFPIVQGDVFAPAGLYAYAHNIWALLEYTQGLDVDPFNAKDRGRLEGLADMLVDMADSWKNSPTKIPD